MITRRQVLTSISEWSTLADACVFVGNGLNAREFCDISDKAQHFYMMGSMGMCAPLAAGFSHCADRAVFAVEGDGNSLMGLSSLPIMPVVCRGPFIHIVLDNGVYESTGGQQTLARHVDFAALARAAGYDFSDTVGTITQLNKVISAALHELQVRFLHVVTGQSTSDRTASRVPHSPPSITSRFRTCVQVDDIKKGPEGLRV